MKSARRKLSKLAVLASALFVGAALRPMTVRAQTFTQVACSGWPDPTPGDWTVTFPSTGFGWRFNLEMEGVAFQSLSGTYSGHPDPATSENSDGLFRSLVWTGVSATANCYIRSVPGANNTVIETRLYSSESAYGKFDYVYNGDDGPDPECDYAQPMYSDPDPCDYSGAGGGNPADGGDDGSEDPTTGTIGDVCSMLPLDPGCYDVFVDDTEYGEVCC